MSGLVVAMLVATAAIYIAVSLSLFVFGANLIHLSIRVWRRGPGPHDSCRPIAEADLPLVTVQLPIYNEFYVSERIIRAACAFDYPRDRLEIQVLDDSTDETTLIIAQVVAEARAQGINVVHHHRRDRTGYKAGALAEGLSIATGEFIAIFDADFVPEADFLRRTLPHFTAPNTAFVQARWGHVNRGYSWLTRLQAVAIDGHFLVEQSGRGDAGYWFNFNGTAGVWRAAAILDAGGWKADTLTEDLDLSYRAHLRGWRAVYVEEVVVPSEVPVHLTGFRRQQDRWARGSIECAFRLLIPVWRSSAPLMTKAQASLHLCAYSIQLLLLALLLIYPLVILASARMSQFSTLFGVGYVFAFAALAPTAFFVTGSRQGGRVWWRDLPGIGLVTVFGAGLMLNTARAALQIFTRPNPSFERTAKFGVDLGGRAVADTAWQLKRYQLDTDRIVWAELVLAAYAAAVAWMAARYANWGIFVYACIFGAGLLMVSVATLRDSLLLWRSRGERAVAVAAERRALGHTGAVSHEFPNHLPSRTVECVAEL
ncbi:MAG: glycosyltransferase [Actinomycetota bacterium]|nr:glycosyltransferase [Actinomycetota bacterium]